MGNIHNRFITSDRLLPNCESGDLLEILHPRSSFNHWAVYVGEGAVIHVQQPWVKRESLQSAVRGNSEAGFATSLVRVNNYKHKTLKIPAQMPLKIVESAYEQLGIEWYNMQLYGCEMFAIRCRYGVKVDVRKNFYKCTDIVKPTDSDVALSNPVANFGHQQHEIF